MKRLKLFSLLVLLMAATGAWAQDADYDIDVDFDPYYNPVGTGFNCMIMDMMGTQPKGTLELFVDGESKGSFNVNGNMVGGQIIPALDAGEHDCEAVFRPQEGGVFFSGNRGFTINKADTDIYGDSGPINMGVGESTDLFVFLNPDQAGELDYVSSDASVVSITKAGGNCYTIQANAAGTATITFSFAGNTNYEAADEDITIDVTVVGAPEPTITVYFTDSQFYGDVNVYYWPNGGDWPGQAMTEVETNGYGQKIYSAEVPASCTGVIFNGNGRQTVDITENIVDGAWWFAKEWTDEIGHNYVELVSVNLNEANDVTPTIAEMDGKVVNVTLTRTFNENWATFVVPFDIDNATLRAQFGDGVQVSTVAATDEAGADIEFVPMATPAITANVPVLIKVSTIADNNQYTFNGVKIENGNPVQDIVSDGSVQFVGNYVNGWSIPATGANAYYYVKDNYLVNSQGAYINGFRAYFYVVGDVPQAKSFFENFSFSEATGVKTIDNGELIIDNAVIYDLQGRRVANPTRGLYIVNGKKVIIK